MPFFFYIQATYTARAEGATDVVVCCENCGEQYSYRLRRAVVARFRSPYLYHDPDTGRKRAQELANKRLQRMLDKEAEVVPCPKCGWHQKEMIPLMRRARLHWCFWVAGALALVVPILFIAGMLYFSKRHMDEQMLVPWSVSMGLILLGAPACLLLRWVLNLRYDPNKDILRGKFTPGEDAGD
jgi:hypothetical protein